MEKTDSIKNIAEAMVKFQIEVAEIKKSAENPFFHSKYAPLDEILKVIKEPLSNNGLSFMQFPAKENELTTLVMHTSGEWIMETYYMKPVKNDPQAYGSVITYQRRYALSSIFGLNTEDDDDANITSEPKKKKDTREFFTRKQVESANLCILKNEFKVSGDVIIKTPEEFIEYLDKTYQIKNVYLQELKDNASSSLKKKIEIARQSDLKLEIENDFEPDNKDESK